MAINNVSAQYNGGLLPDIILLTQSYHHRGIRLNAMKKFCIYLQPMIPPKRFDIFPPDWEMLRRSTIGAFRFLFNNSEHVVVVVFFTLTDRASTIPSRHIKIWYVCM